MKVRLLKKLRKEIHKNLSVHRNSSKFTMNWAYLSITFKGIYYRTGRRYRTYNNDIFIALQKELEHIVLKDYINIKKYKE